MDTSGLELHDAQLLGVALDAVRRTAEVKLACYPNEHASERILGMLRFSEVSHFTQLADLDLLEEHFQAGNVSQWVTGERPGISYIYLARGLIAVTAASVELVDPA